MDMQLPTMTGSKDQTWRSNGIPAPIIAMTAAKTGQMPAGRLHDFIAKPIDCGVLIQILCKYVSPAQVVLSA
jgi:FixJ family two-component response regulator